jgi:phosphoglycerate dehydrogenase-like enzyme
MHQRSQLIARTSSITIVQEDEYTTKRKVLLPWPKDQEFATVIAAAETPLQVLQEIAEVETADIPDDDAWFQRSRDAVAILRPEIEESQYPAFLAQARELRMIQTPSIGYDGMDVAACTAHGVLVCNVLAYAESAAQHTWALILAVAKHITRADRLMRDGGWPEWPRGFFGTELHGQTLGVIGLGDIGGRVARKGALAFNMRVLAYDPFVSQSRAQRDYAQLVSLETLVREADVIAIHCPLTPQTHHLLGARELQYLKSTAILVNTARGGIIDEAALSSALAQGHLFGAGLDVFEEEPLSPTSPLRQLDNVVLTPHFAYATTQAVSQTWVGAVHNILRFLTNQTPHWIVNPQAQYTAQRRE